MYTQGHASLYFNQCSIFTEYCFQLLNRFEWSKYLLAKLLPLDKEISPAKFPLSSYPLALFGKPCLTMRQTETIISPLQQCLWPPNLVSWWLILWASIQIVTQSLQGKLKNYISTITVPLTLKLDRVMKCYEEFPLIKWHDPWITWFCELDMFIKTEKTSGVQIKP